MEKVIKYLNPLHRIIGFITFTRLISIFINAEVTVVTRISEQETRYALIDPELKKAGWNIADRTQVRFEIPVDKYDSKPDTEKIGIETGTVVSEFDAESLSVRSRRVV